MGGVEIKGFPRPRSDPLPVLLLLISTCFTSTKVQILTPSSYSLPVLLVFFLLVDRVDDYRVEARLVRRYGVGEEREEGGVEIRILFREPVGEMRQFHELGLELQ